MLLSGHHLGILAGSGQLPLEVAAEVERQGRRVHIVGIAGEADAAIERFDHTWIEWGQIGALLRAFRRAGCRELIIIGGVRRPDLRAVRVDAGFFLNLPLILSLGRGGDDSVLRRVIGFFESRDFTVRGVPEVAPDLVAGAGVWSTEQPDDADRRDMTAGFRLIEALGPFDVGQAVVIAEGRPVAIEAAEGTDGMLQRLASARERARAAGRPAQGGVLVKAPKRGQELRVDMPAIGPRTVELAAAARLSGVAVAAGPVLIAGRDRLHSLAEERDLFLYGADTGEVSSGAPSHVLPPTLGSAERLAGRPPSREAQADIERAWGVARTVAGFDAGDGVISIRRHVLAVGADEPAEGVLERVGTLRQWGEQNRQWRRRSGVLAISAPPRPGLLTRAAEAGLSGIVVTGRARCDRAKLAAAAESARRHGLFLMQAPTGRDAGDEEEGRGAMTSTTERARVQHPLPDQPASERRQLSGVTRPLHLFLVAGEHSGDALGGKLMTAIRERLGSEVAFAGVGGQHMEDQGLDSLFPLADVAVMGPLSILPRLPRIVRRVYRTVDAAIAAEPDVVVIVDSPEFTHPIAKRIRKRCPQIPIIDYVSPSVWAWRPGRARKMRPYVDHVLGLLPFEPEAHARLGGPPCSYVGHPLIERMAWMRSLDDQALAGRLQLDRRRPVLVVLPGSRSSEVERLMQPFGEAIALLRDRGVAPEVIIPALPNVRNQIEHAIQSWPIEPHLVEGEDDKFRAFKLAGAALAASGTVTLELALAGTPMVVGYRVDALAARLRFLVKVPSVVLANLVLGENSFPELLQEDCTGEKLGGALLPLLANTAERARQLEALARIPKRLELAQGTPSEAAAEIVLDYAMRSAARRPVR